VSQHCDGCLGRRSCWICLGTGYTDTERKVGECPTCHGTGVCSYCDPTLPPVIDLETGPERAALERAIIDALKAAAIDDDTPPNDAHILPRSE
jgi:hypothetical protein